MSSTCNFKYNKYWFFDGYNCCSKIIKLGWFPHNNVNILKIRLESLINQVRDMGNEPCFIFDGFRSSKETVEKLFTRRVIKINEGKQDIPYGLAYSFISILRKLKVCIFTTHDCDADDLIATYADYFPNSTILSSDSDFYKYNYSNKPDIIYKFYFNMKEKSWEFCYGDRDFLIDLKSDEDNLNEIKNINNDLIKDSDGNFIDIKIYDDNYVDFISNKKFCQDYSYKCSILKQKVNRLGQSCFSIKLVGNFNKYFKPLRQALYYQIFKIDNNISDEDCIVKESYFDYVDEKLIIHEEDVKPSDEYLEILRKNPQKCLEELFNSDNQEKLYDLIKNYSDEKFALNIFTNEMYSIYSIIYHYHCLVTNKKNFGDVIYNAFNKEFKCKSCPQKICINIISIKCKIYDLNNLVCKSCKMRKIRCKFWENGYCVHGDNCKKYHDKSFDFNKLCPHFHNENFLGSCNSGINCMFIHDHEKIKKMKEKLSKNKFFKKINKNKKQ